MPAHASAVQLVMGVQPYADEADPEVPSLVRRAERPIHRSGQPKEHPLAAQVQQS